MRHPVVLLFVQSLEERWISSEFGSVVTEPSSAVPPSLVVFDWQDSIAVLLEGCLGSVLKCEVLDQLTNLTLHGYHLEYVVNTFPIVSAHLDNIFKLLVCGELDGRCLAKLTKLECLAGNNPA